MQPEGNVDNGRPSPRAETPAPEQVDDVNLMDEKLRTEYLLSECGTCTLKPGEQHGWKPPTMKAPVLISFAMFSVLIILCLEFLAQRSQKNGGLSLVDDADELTGLVTFAYLYLPLIVAGVYSMLWNWIDLDVKRIQPWLELSRPMGARGKDSLFLDYPVDFVGFVPFRTAKRRHWPVFFSGTTMVLILWIITPLQSSVMGTKFVLLNNTAQMVMPSQFMDSEAQAAVLDQAVLNAAYAITWLDQPYPAFTTPDYALMPFHPVDSKKGKVANFTGLTTKYWTDLHCWPASISPKVPTRPINIHFDNGRGCNTSAMALGTQPGEQNMLYVGWWDSPWADYSLEMLGCGEETAGQFLATWAYQGNGTTMDISAVFCEASYFKQKVKALVQADGFAPVDDHIEALEAPIPLMTTEFNSSAFEFLIGVGMSSKDIPREYPFSHLLDQWPRVEDTGIMPNLWSPMIGFALGETHLPLKAFSDHDVLQSTYQNVHRRIFSVAFQTVFTNSTSTKTSEGASHIVKYGVVVSRLFSALVEVFLGLAIILVMGLLWHCHRSQSMLSSDPGSLGHLFEVVQSSSILRRKLTGTGTWSSEKLEEKLGQCQFKLVCGCRDFSGRSTLRLIGGLNEDWKYALGMRFEKGLDEHLGHYSPIKPLALRQLVGFSFSLVLCAALVALTYLRFEDYVIGGLTQPSSNFEVNIFLTNYVPTIVATLIEPFWVILNRMLCLLQPFYDLLSDRGTAERTINARYMALPPQLALGRAFKSGHFLLGLVCVTALMGNVLSVGLGAMFNDRPAQKTYPMDMVRQRLSYNELQHLGEDTTTPDNFYVMQANLSYGTPLPPWMTSELAFWPIDLSFTNYSSDGVYSAVSVGFGIEPSCKSLGSFTTKDMPPPMDPSYGDPGGNFTNCVRYTPPEVFNLKKQLNFPSDGPSTAELVSSFSPDSGPLHNCVQSTLFGWSRCNITNSTGTLHSSFVICNPVLQVQEYNITFDYLGHILSFSATKESISKGPYSNLTTALSPFLSVVKNMILQSSPWHNDNVSTDYFQYLLRLKSIPDIYTTSTPTPDPEKMLPLVESLYKMFFATTFNLLQGSLANTGHDTIVGARTVTETRISFSSPAFIVSISILGLYLLMAVLFYGYCVIFFLPRMPSTVGSLLAYIATSSLANKMPDRKECLDDKTFRFGRLLGPDGRAHIGIDISEKVVPLDPLSLVKGDTKRRSRILGFRTRFPFRRRRGEGQVLI